MRRREFVRLLGAAAVSMPGLGHTQERGPVIGFLHQGSAEPSPNMNTFRTGLSEAGVENAIVEDRVADGHYDRLPALAAELVRNRVTVIAANFLPAALAAKGRNSNHSDCFSKRQRSN
jgi:putative ABC transport system substrate-binding protein